jgi:hypothetical protein
MILSLLDPIDKILLHPYTKNLESNDEEKRSLSKETTSFEREKIRHSAKEAFLEITTEIVIWTIFHLRAQFSNKKYVLFYI